MGCHFTTFNVLLQWILLEHVCAEVFLWNNHSVTHNSTVCARVIS